MKKKRQKLVIRKLLNQAAKNHQSETWVLF